MKNSIATSACKVFILLCSAFLFLPATSRAQVERSKDVRKSFAAKQEVSVEHRYGPLEVKRSANGKIRVEATLVVKAREETGLQEIFDRFDIMATESGNRLVLKTDFKVRNWNSSNGNLKIQFEDGTRVKNLRDLKIRFTLYVPTLEKLELANRYEDINIREAIDGNLTVKLYSGRIDAADVKGNLQIDMKYSKGNVGNFSNGKLTFYDCDLSLGNGKAVNLTSKYSEISLGSAGNLSANIYDDRLAVSLVKGTLILEDKYSEIEIGTFGKARMDLYDSNFSSEGGDDLQLKSKYTEYKINSLGSLYCELSYDDVFKIDELGSFTADSKYTEFYIKTLKSRLSITSYDDEINIQQFSGPLEGIDFEGKYTDFSVDLPRDASYRIQANLTYGNLNIPEDRFDFQIYKEKNDRIELKGRTKGAGEESPFIKINSYDGKIDIR